jgi:hypothetical protein
MTHCPPVTELLGSPPCWVCIEFCYVAVRSSRPLWLGHLRTRTGNPVTGISSYFDEMNFTIVLNTCAPSLRDCTILPSRRE